MGLRFEIEVFGDVQFSRELIRVGDKALNLDPAFRSIFMRLMEINAEQFRSRGSRGSGGWPDLKPETILQKAREGVSDPSAPLRRTDALFEAMTSPGDSNNEMLFNGDWAVWRITGDPAIIGGFHQSGAPSANLPARPPFALTDEDRREFVREMEAFIFGGYLRNFL